MFIDNRKNYPDGDDQLEKFTGIYQLLVAMNKDDINMLAKVEELIMQYRHYYDFVKNPNIRFAIGGTGNNFIYAYINFYRQGYVRADLKVLVGKTEVYGADHHKFVGNQDLMQRSHKRLDKTMNEIIRNTEEDVNKILENKFGNINNIR